MSRRQLALLLDNGTVVHDPSWMCVADVIYGFHGFALRQAVGVIVDAETLEQVYPSATQEGIRMTDTDTEGPATVTLTDDEIDLLAGAGNWPGFVTRSNAIQEVAEAIVAARVEALTADLAAARAEAVEWSIKAGHRESRAERAERVIANVRALADLGVREQWPPDEWRAGLRALLSATDETGATT